MSTELARRIAAEHAAAAPSLPSAVIAPARRRRAIDALVSTGLPTTRDENWRYANLRPLERVRFAPAPARIDITAAELPAPIPDFARYVFLDGLYAAGASQPQPRRADLTVRIPSGTASGGERSRSEAAQDLEGAEASGSSSEAAFALLNEAFALDCAQIEVTGAEGAVEAPACIEVVFVAGTPAPAGSSYPRLRVHLGPHARLRLIERHVSLGAEPSAFVDSAVDVRLDGGASLDHYRIQALGAQAVWMDTLGAVLGGSAAYRLHAIGLGALAARSNVRVRLGGEGAQLALHAVAVGDHAQVLDTYALVEHAACHTRTTEHFRGIAAGRSRVAFNGKIIVQPGARGADSTQSLRGLIAGSAAEIDVRPQLEIYTDEVRCSHGATAGKLDETMLFYLLSRGLDADTARRLLKWAFLEDVVSRIDIAALRRQIETSLAGQLPERDTLKELL